MLPPFEIDIALLLQKFWESHDLSFVNFKKIWKTINFDLVLICLPPDLNHLRPGYMSILFSTILTKYLQIKENIYIQVGSFYLLYILYRIQPCFPKIRFTVNHDLMNFVDSFVQSLSDDPRMESSNFVVSNIENMYEYLLDADAFHIRIPNSLELSYPLLPSATVASKHKLLTQGGPPFFSTPKSLKSLININKIVDTGSISTLELLYSLALADSSQNSEISNTTIPQNISTQDTPLNNLKTANVQIFAKFWETHQTVKQNINSSLKNYSKTPDIVESFPSYGTKTIPHSQFLPIHTNDVSLLVHEVFRSDTSSLQQYIYSLVKLTGKKQRKAVERQIVQNSKKTCASFVDPDFQSDSSRGEPKPSSSNEIIPQFDNDSKSQSLSVKARSEKIRELFLQYHSSVNTLQDP